MHDCYISFMGFIGTVFSDEIIVINILLVLLLGVWHPDQTRLD